MWSAAVGRDWLTARPCTAAAAFSLRCCAAAAAVNERVGPSHSSLLKHVACTLALKGAWAPGRGPMFHTIAGSCGQAVQRTMASLWTARVVHGFGLAAPAGARRARQNKNGSSCCGGTTPPCTTKPCNPRGRLPPAVLHTSWAHVLATRPQPYRSQHEDRTGHAQ